VTRHYGRPGEGVHALQLEIAMCAYLDEARPERYRRARAAPLVKVLERLVAALIGWKPGKES
jgi:N-formylglutamate amidohydrolase